MDCPIEASEAVVEVYDTGQKSDTVGGPAGRVDESAPDGAIGLFRLGEDKGGNNNCEQRC